MLVNMEMPQRYYFYQQEKLHFFAGYPLNGALGPALGPPLATGAAGCHGFWMHTAADGRSGYLVPGWLAAY